MKQNETQMKHKWNKMKHRKRDKYLKNKAKPEKSKKCVSFVSKIPPETDKDLINNKLCCLLCFMFFLVFSIKYLVYGNLKILPKNDDAVG